MNEILITATFIATAVSLYALLAGQGSRRNAFATLFTASTATALVVDGSVFMHVMGGLTAVTAAAGFIRETRKDVA